MNESDVRVEAAVGPGSGDARPNRREWLQQAVGAAVAVAGAASAQRPGALCRAEDAAPGESGFIVRSRRPLDLETPVGRFDRLYTPNRLFFMRSHFFEPAVGLGPWRLEVGGRVDRPLSLSLDDLRAMKRVTIPAVLQCSGNGRVFFQPRVPGVGWERGAVGNAAWEGVRLVDVLERAGVEGRPGHVHLLGADPPPSSKTPAFLRSIPMERALDPDTLVAFVMNGEPLPHLHGGPMRLVVPGWAGNHWMKWLRQITIADDEAPGTYMQTAYRMPKVPVPPGTDPKPSDLAPVTALNVKSLIAGPAEGAKLPRGRHEVHGVAWTGEGRVSTVEVATGPNDRWQPATLQDEAGPHSWRLWSWTWDADRAGTFVIRARASDSRGNTQPEITPWNRSGYLWNGIDRVACEIL
jgi:sulfite oxidase